MNIGDKIIITETGAIGSIADKTGRRYIVVDDDGVYIGSFKETEIEEIAEESDDTPSFELCVQKADNVIIVIIRDADGDEITRGHGHIIHSGVFGEIQAFSWACKKAFENTPGYENLPNARPKDYRGFLDYKKRYNYDGE